MLTTNVLMRIFKLRYGGKSGTCFTMEVDHRQYLVTAHHLVKNIEKNDTISIFHEERWKMMEVTVVWTGDEGHDVTIFSPQIQLSPSFPLEPTSAGMVVGQDVYFCGYPYHMDAGGSEMNRGFPLPLIKRGTLSGFFIHLLIIDALNNPGFSGGPVVWSPISDPQSYRVSGVISGYRPEYKPVIYKDDKGEWTNHETMKFEHNTGLVQAYTLDDAVEFLKEHPAGIEVQ